MQDMKYDYKAGFNLRKIALKQKEVQRKKKEMREAIEARNRAANAAQLARKRKKKARDDEDDEDLPGPSGGTRATEGSNSRGILAQRGGNTLATDLQALADETKGSGLPRGGRREVAEKP